MEDWPDKDATPTPRTTLRARYVTLLVLLARMRHESCGGLAGKAELLTGIEGISSRPVRKIVRGEG